MCNYTISPFIFFESLKFLFPTLSRSGFDSSDNDAYPVIRLSARWNRRRRSISIIHTCTYEDSSRRGNSRSLVTLDTNGNQRRLSTKRERERREGIQLVEYHNSAMHGLALRVRGVHGFVRPLLIKARS